MLLFVDQRLGAFEHGVTVLEGLGRRLLDGKGRACCRHNRSFALEVRSVEREGPLGVTFDRLLWHELLETGFGVCLYAFHFFFSWLRVRVQVSRMGGGRVCVFVGC